MSYSAEKIRRGTILCCVRENIPVAKNYMDRKRGFQDFPSKNFCLTLPQFFARKLFCFVFQKTSGSEKVYG